MRVVGVVVPAVPVALPQGLGGDLCQTDLAADCPACPACPGCEAFLAAAAEGADGAVASSELAWLVPVLVAGAALLCLLLLALLLLLCRARDRWKTPHAMPTTALPMPSRLPCTRAGAGGPACRHHPAPCAACAPSVIPVSYTHLTLPTKRIV